MFENVIMCSYCLVCHLQNLKDFLSFLKYEGDFFFVALFFGDTHYILYMHTRMHTYKHIYKYTQPGVFAQVAANND